MSTQGNTATSPQPESGKSGTTPNNPGKDEQNPGTSRGQDEDVTGTKEERGQADKPEGTDDEAVTEETGSDPDAAIRNPSGDDIGDAVDGDEGSGRRV